MVAVAAIWVKAPAITQGQNIAGGRGSPSPSTVMTPSRNRMANGKPNKNRTCVAPTVPSVAVSSRCMALRAVCAPAAITVKTAQSMLLCGVARGDQHVVDVHVRRQLPAVGERIVDDAALAGHPQA